MQRISMNLRDISCAASGERVIKMVLHILKLKNPITHTTAERLFALFARWIISAFGENILLMVLYN